MNERYLANENFPRAIVKLLREEGNDVMHAAEVLVGAPDEELLRIAVSEDRVLLTFDRDFGELVFHQQHPAASGIVLFRLRQQPPTVVLRFLRAFFSSAPTLRGFFPVGEPGRVRQTPLAGDAG